MANWLRTFLALALLFSGFASAWANSQTTALLEAAIASYQKAQATTDNDARAAQFNVAARQFLAATEHRPNNPKLWTNVGTSALQAEQTGLAVLAFRRALALDPNDKRASQNLEVARGRLPEWMPKPSTSGTFSDVFFWHHSLSNTERRLIGATFFALGALLLAVAIRWRVSWMRTAAWVPAIGWLAIMGSAAVHWIDNDVAHAVVTVDSTPARASDSQNAPIRFREPLSGGVEVEIVDTRGTWTRVRLANGLEAWVVASAVTLVSTNAKETP